jgi:hypothetical protein
MQSMVNLISGSQYTELELMAEELYWSDKCVLYYKANTKVMA